MDDNRTQAQSKRYYYIHCTHSIYKLHKKVKDIYILNFFVYCIYHLSLGLNFFSKYEIRFNSL